MRICNSLPYFVVFFKHDICFIQTGANTLIYQKQEMKNED